MRKLRITECREDSPLLRSRISYFEDATDQLERRLNRTATLARHMQDVSRQQVELGRAIADEISSFAGTIDNDDIDQSLRTFAAALKAIEENRDMMAQQVNTALRLTLEKIAKIDVKLVQESKVGFQKASTDLQAASERFCAVRKQDIPGLLEAGNALYEAKREFHRKSCQYAMAHNSLHAKTRIIYLEKILDYMTSNMAFYQVANNLTQSMEPRMNGIFKEVKTLKQEYQEQDKIDNEEYEHDLKVIDQRRSDAFLRFQTNDLVQQKPTVVPHISDTTKSGYLNLGERKALGGMTWQRYYFYVIDGLLLQQASWKDPPVPKANLITCTCKPAEDVDRNFCFQVISPQTTFYLQAESSEDMAAWMQVLTNAIAGALHKQQITPRSPSVSKAASVEPGAGEQEDRTADLVPLLAQIMAKNPACAECNAPNPDWASINIGVCVCIQCSGIHRSLGVLISQVRSLTLDKWKPDMLKVLMETSNTEVNKVYEALVPKELTKPTAASDRPEKEEWIRAKYVDLAFTPKEEKMALLAKRAKDMEFMEAQNRLFAEEFTRRQQEEARLEEQRLMDETNAQGSASIDSAGGEEGLLQKLRKSFNISSGSLRQESPNPGDEDEDEPDAS